jgi:hypothetical protein
MKEGNKLEKFCDNGSFYIIARWVTFWDTCKAVKIDPRPLLGIVFEFQRLVLTFVL